jgi:hypothetical protein
MIRNKQNFKSGTDFSMYLEGNKVVVSRHTVKENTIALIVTRHLFVFVTGGIENSLHSVSHMLTIFAIQKLMASDNCVTPASVFNEYLC